MMSSLHRLTVSLSLVAAVGAPALAEDGPVTHTDQLIVVTPNPPVVITNGTPSAAPGAGPSSVAPVAQPAAVAAPQNEDWSNVNHINGQIVKVGEKSEYLIKFKKTNLATNPIGFLFGFYGASFSHALSNHVAIRLDGNLFNIDGTSGYEFGASLPIYFRRTYSGPFFEPGLITRGFRNNYDYAYDCYDCSSGSMDTMVGPEMLFGWHWMFDSGLNVAMAFGAARDLSDDGDEYDYDTDVEPAGYFRIGYAF